MCSHWGYKMEQSKYLIISKEYGEKRKEHNQMQQNSKMADLNTAISVIALNVNKHQEAEIVRLDNLVVNIC